jgi:Dual-action HEIGH metallo-peptidase
MYTCGTQHTFEPTYSYPPDRDDNDGPSSIVVGLDDDTQILVPRLQAPLLLEWFLCAETFPSPDIAATAGQALEQAAQEWNAVTFGVTVSQTKAKAEAHFNLVYEKNPADRARCHAVAFFPCEPDVDLVVYEYGIKEAIRTPLQNVFQHELGHIFGLRHEFAIAREGDGAKQFMEENELSVMAYNPVPVIQESDKEGICAFYKLKNGADIDGSPIVDYSPPPRWINQSKP